MIISDRLADFGKHVGIRVLDLFFLRVGKDKRETRLTQMLVFLQKSFWKVGSKGNASPRLGNSFLSVFIQSRSRWFRTTHTRSECLSVSIEFIDGM